MESSSELATVRNAMNRIERLLWEEDNLRVIKRSKRRSRVASLARSVSIALVVGAFLMFATRLAPSMQDARSRPLMDSTVAERPAPTPSNPSGTGSTAAMSTPDGPHTAQRTHGPGEATEAAF